MRPYINFAVTDNEEFGVRYSSGLTVFDERLVEGKFINRWWTTTGHILTDMHMGQFNFIEEGKTFPLQVFRLVVNGCELTDGWNRLGAGEGKDTTGLRGKASVMTVGLRHSTVPVEVRINTRIDGSNMSVRWLDIINTGTEALPLTAVYPMSGRVWAHTKDYLEFREVLPEDGADMPLAVAYDHKTGALNEADFRFDAVKAGETLVKGSRRGKSGYNRPAFWLRNRLNNETFVCEFAYSGNWNFEIFHDNQSMPMQSGFSIGIPQTAEGEHARVLAPGEAVSTPLVHFGLFHCDDDKITQALHSHVRGVVMPECPRDRICEIESNHRGYLCDRESVPGIKADEDVAAFAGAEMYVVDAGWYGRSPNRWWKNTGDWFAGDWLEGGLEPISDHAHKHGMKFGLWVEAESAGVGTKLKEDHPDWVASRDGDVQAVARARALDFSKPEVVEWMDAVISRLIKQYKLDMFRIDHNHELNIGPNREYLGFKENLLWRYYENLYGVFDRAIAAHPHCTFQNCAGGGGRLDLGILQRFHNTEMSDWMRSPRVMRMFSNMTQILPPEIMLRTFGTEYPEMFMEGDVDTQLRMSILGRPIFRGIAPSLDELNPVLHERMNHHLQLFRDFIRPVMIDSLVFHHTPMQVLNASNPWVCIEYAAPDMTRAVAAVFRTAPSHANGTGTSEAVFQLYPKGLDRASDYNVRFDNSGATVVIGGHALMNEGLRIELPAHMSSELIMFQAVDSVII